MPMPGATPSAARRSGAATARSTRLYNWLFRELLTYMMEDPRTIGLSTHLLFVAKNIERIGDHATNIAETVHYRRDGGAYRRPTGPRATRRQQQPCRYDDKP